MTALTCPTMISPMAEEQPLKKLHPFFTGERAPTQPFISQNGAPLEATTNAPTTTTPDAISDTTPKGARPRKRRKTDAGDKSAEQKGRRTRRKVTGSLDSSEIESIASNSPEPHAVVSNLVGNAGPDANAIPPVKPESAILSSATCESLPNPPPNPTPSTESSKKVIKFNPKTGTLGSPPKPKPKCESGVPGASAPSSTTRKAKRKSLVVHIKYGHDDESRSRLGGQIEQILVQPAKTPQPPILSKQTPKSQTTGTPKPTHPFFSGKPKKAGIASGSLETADTPAKPPRQVIFSSTPCSPKRCRAPPPKQGLTFGIKSAGLKVPGATLPLWPPKGMSHIRALDLDSSTRVPPPPQQHSFPQRKSKGYAVGLSDSESILQSTIRAIDFSSILTSLRQANSYDIPPPPPELRLPQKHFETGPKVQRRIKPQLKTHHGPSRRSIVESSEDELGHQVHPAINKLFTLLKTSLSAFDRSDCESACWAQKYAPQSTAEVLQAGKECTLLREWLLNLKVQSVDTGAASDAGPRGSKGPNQGKAGGGVLGKKKKKRAKLDGFIVSSDDEADELDEISDSENNWMSPKGKGCAKTVIRCGDLAAKAKDSRLTNAIVISGPHGCGKTAAVYAIAKELDYEVFEINASSRRSGKDVIEKVGDMTRNHLVQQQRNGLKSAEGGNDTDAEETALDIKSGKQSTMASFFKPKTTPAAKPKVQAKDLGDKPEAPAKTTTTQSTKSQKQSLILLEEVDILYEEDKQFWTTIVTLIAQSKRPFIMTCNDESLVPLQSLSLHGIFRFTTPPTDLAVDAMLLIAANEGHVLERRPVEDLYLMRSKDFRASLTDLNYWCQIGVGDRRGGMDWFYSRWPKGSDLDENGDVVRIISEGTYRAGMGCFGRDVVASCLTQEEVEEELVNQTWESWGVSCDTFLQAKNPEAFVACNSDDGAAVAKGRRIEGLAAFEELAESMSTADLLANGGFGQGFKERIDPTLPEVNSRARDDYILGRTLLDAPLLVNHRPLSNYISTAGKCLARATFRKLNENETIAHSSSALPPLNEASAVSNIRAAAGEHQDCRAINRMDMSLAFDPIAASDKFPTSALGYLDPSVFDRTMTMIVLDVAPFVRTIVAFDERLKKERLRLGTLLSENNGGPQQRPAKRMRQTRSAMSALEGGSRSTTRRERYFAADINPYLVARTGARAWQNALDEVLERAAQEARLKAAEDGETDATLSADGEDSVGSGA